MCIRDRFIQSNALKEFIEERKKEYDLILLDCPPVGLVTDGIVAASYCDGTILVCASNRNDRKELLRVKDQLEQTQVNVIGIVMTMMPVQRKYYNSYGYRYSDTQKKTTQKKKKNSILSDVYKRQGRRRLSAAGRRYRGADHHRRALLRADEFGNGRDNHLVYSRKGDYGLCRGYGWRLRTVQCQLGQL